MSSGRDHLTLWGRVCLKNPRSVILLNPYQFPVMVGLLVLSVIFTFWPEALEHAPTSFEERGFVHHAWHYTLLAGSATTLVGMFTCSAWRLKAELIGLLLIIGALSVNLTALLADSIASGVAVSGITVALRIALIVGHLIRAYIVATQPMIDMKSTQLRS